MKTKAELERVIRTKIKQGIKVFCFVIVNGPPTWFKDYLKDQKDNAVIHAFPEERKSIPEQYSIVSDIINKTKDKINFILTKSPVLVSDFDRKAVLIVRDSKIEPPTDQTFGKSLNMILFSIFGITYTCGFLAMEKLRELEEQAAESNNIGELEKIEDTISSNFGDSVEKSIILNNVINKLDRITGGGKNYENR